MKEESICILLGVIAMCFNLITSKEAYGFTTHLPIYRTKEKNEAKFTVTEYQHKLHLT